MSAFQFESKRYPNAPGCYLMKDGSGRIIYVGKAKNLRNRLRSYFRKTVEHKRTRELVREIRDIEVILVNNEPESLFLENNLIKRHKPKFNRALKKDNSGYTYMKLTDEKYPRFDVHYRNRSSALSATHGPEAYAKAAMEAAQAAQSRMEEAAAQGTGNPEGSPKTRRGAAGAKPAGKAAGAKTGAAKSKQGGELQKFGPYPSSRFRNALLEFIISHYGIRTCAAMPKRACLLYHINKCSGICQGYISDEEYAERVKEAARLLANRENELIEELRVKMMHYAERWEFEKAERMKRHIQSLERMLSKQIVDRETNHNQDVIYFGEAHAMVVRLHEGMVQGMELAALELEEVREYEEAQEAKEAKEAKEAQQDEVTAALGGMQLPEDTTQTEEPSPDDKKQRLYEQACRRFLADRYSMDRPEELIMNYTGDFRVLKQLLYRKNRSRLALTVPKRGIKAELLQLAQQNYEYRMSGKPAGKDGCGPA